VKLLGLYKRDRHYYIKVVLPKDHPLRAYFKSGRWVKSLGLCSYREAVRLATVKRAEILGNYTAVDDPKTPIGLRDVYEKWMVALPRTKDTIASCGYALALFEKQFPNFPIAQLKGTDGHKFRNWLLTECSTTKTARDKLVWVKSLLRFATFDLGLLPVNPWNALKIESRPTNLRTPWTKTALDKLFDHEIWQKGTLPTSKKSGGIAAYWVPLLGLHTGARCSELCQLEKKDIQVIDGVHVILITDTGDEQRVKTFAGKRIIPIHSKLIELGFLEFVATQREGSLWINLNKREDRAGGFFSAYFGELRKKLGIPKSIVFHSFRHTVRSELAKTIVQEKTIDLLLGHESPGSVGAKVYTHVPVQTLKDTIEKLHFELKIEPIFKKLK
jgi:integrase